MMAGPALFQCGLWKRVLVKRCEERGMYVIEEWESLKWSSSRDVWQEID